MNQGRGDTHPATTISPPATTHRSAIGYLPVLDVARGCAAGYQAVALASGTHDGVPAHQGLSPSLAMIDAALAAFHTLPTNTFICLPIPLPLLGDRAVRAALRAHGDLSGIIVDVTGFTPHIDSETEAALAAMREAGARISVGGSGSAQPELGSIVRLRPSVVRLGRAWIDGLAQSAAKRAAIEVTGQLTTQLGAWILAEDVSSAAELRALAQLGVPLAQGPFIGSAEPTWSQVRQAARAALPQATSPSSGTLRHLVWQTHTTPDHLAAQHLLDDSTDHETVMVIDDLQRPVDLLLREVDGTWQTSQILTVNIDTPVPDAISRAMARPHDQRFAPLVCTDAAGRFVGMLKIEQLIAELTNRPG